MMPSEQPDQTYAVETAPQNLIDTARDLKMAVSLIEQLRGGSAVRAPFPNVTDMIDALLRGVPYINYSLTSPFKIFRGRISNDMETLTRPSEFSYRQAEDVKSYGRCHCPGTTVFYGATNLDTVLSELTPEVGDKIHVGVAALKKDQDFNVTAIGEIDHVRRYGRPLIGNTEATEQQQAILEGMPGDEGVRSLLVDAFFADLFAQPAYKQRDYKATSALAGLILDATVEDDRKVNDGFAYPSVGHRGGLNFAIKPDRFDEVMEWEHFMAFEIIDYLGFGLYGRKLYAQASDLDDNGNIVWESLDSHILLHIPRHLSNRFRKLARRWLKEAFGLRRLAKGTLSVTRIWSLGDPYENIRNRVRYILKGADPDTRLFLRCKKWETGIVKGKRAGVSQGLGESARRKAGGVLLSGNRKPSQEMLTNRRVVSPF